MKSLFTLCCIALLSITNLFAQTDAERVANWQLPIDWWFAGVTAPSVGIDAYPRKQAVAEEVTSFDAASADFDAAWATVAGSGNVIANVSGLPASNTGADDFKDAAYKVLYDAGNMYILLQFTDDDVTGTESVELCLSPYFKLDVADRTDFPTAWYTRWSQFGANKLLFNKNGFKEAMMVNFDVDGKGTINWGGTTEILTNNLFIDDKTASGSKTVKWIITVGFPALTGEYKPDFDATIWKALNSGKGISFDLKVNDVDANDALNTDNPPVAKPAEYWWNADNNDCWMSTIYAGFLGVKGSTPNTDADIVANWQLPIDWWFAGATAPAVGIDAYARKEAKAEPVTSFDAAGADFDAAWTANGGEMAIANVLGMPASNNGADDFKDAAYKVLYDASNMYILLQFTDDDVTGTESAELCLSPYFKLDAPDRTDFPTAWYTRWSQFGANKLLFDKNGFNSAMMVNFDADGKGTINWGGTTETLTNNLFLDDKTASGSKTVKWIITVGFPALTGEYKPDFDATIWKALNSGKGISFDLKVNDVDANDALNTDNPPVAKPAEYWWNSDNNDCWMSNMYAGFLGANEPVIVTKTDAEIVANWQLPIDWWFAGATAPAVGIDAYARKEAKAEPVTSFDAAGADFDAAWTANGGEMAIANVLGMPASNNGADDFKDAAYKVLYDASNMYILLQFTDDDVTGTESAELCLSPYFKLDAPDRTDFPTAWYTRWSQFGAYKLLFDKNGFNSAMMVNVDADGKGSINWGGTTETLTNNLFLDDKTASGSKTVKWIITVGYPTLTGEYRPDFNESVWKALNGGKGISFDLKVNDVDANDALNTDNPPVAKPAEYWWNTDNNDCWQSNMYAGYLAAGISTVGLNKPVAAKSIFERVTSTRIEFNKTANVTIYNILGGQVRATKNVNQIDLSNLKSGVYIIRANNESLKIVR